jgi:hypothetical protein
MCKREYLKNDDIIKRRGSSQIDNEPLCADKK